MSETAPMFFSIKIFLFFQTENLTESDKEGTVIRTRNNKKHKIIISRIIMFLNIVPWCVLQRKKKKHSLKLIYSKNLFKPNLIETNLCVPNRQVGGINRLNWQIFSASGLYLKFDLWRIPCYSGFGLDSFHFIRFCISMYCISGKWELHNAWWNKVFIYSSGYGEQSMKTRFYW